MSNLFEYLAIPTGRPRAAAGAGRASLGPEQGVRFEDVGFRYPGAEALGAAARVAVHPARAEPGARGAERRGKDDAHQAAHATVRADRGPHPPRREGPADLGRGGAAPPDRRHLPGLQPVPVPLPGERGVRERRARGGRGAARARGRPRRRGRGARGRCPRGWRRRSADGSRRAPSSPAASGRRWRSRGRSCARRRTSWSSTSRPRRSTPRPSTPSSSGSAQLAHGRTTILISHRFSTVRLADRIVVIERGSIVEQGTHEELMALGGRYAHLFTLQAKGYQ